jgi:hypothetical protein
VARGVRSGSRLGVDDVRIGDRRRILDRRIGLGLRRARGLVREQGLGGRLVRRRATVRIGRFLGIGCYRDGGGQLVRPVRLDVMAVIDPAGLRSGRALRDVLVNRVVRNVLDVLDDRRIGRGRRDGSVVAPVAVRVRLLRGVEEATELGDGVVTGARGAVGVGDLGAGRFHVGLHRRSGRVRRRSVSGRRRVREGFPGGGARRPLDPRPLPDARRPGGGARGPLRPLLAVGRR